jgi:hypothetical protein
MGTEWCDCEDCGLEPRCDYRVYGRNYDCICNGCGRPVRRGRLSAQFGPDAAFRGNTALPHRLLTGEDKRNS